MTGGEPGARVRVPRHGFPFGGWTGTLNIEGDLLLVTGDDPANHLTLDCAQVKRWSFNNLNGLWAFRMKDGTKHYLQTAGGVLAADRTHAGQIANVAIRALVVRERSRRRR